MYLAKIHADLIVKAYTSIGEIFNLMYTIVSEFMRDADKNGLNVVGITSNIIG